METTLITTKLNPPIVSPDWLERPHLISRLIQFPERGFTLVSAPAGFGKSSLIASWAKEQQLPYAWLSLDKYDNDLRMFLGYFLTAIQRIFPNSFSDLDHILQAPDLPFMAALAAPIINGIENLPQRLMLVLDDYHTLNNNRITQLIERMVDQAPTKFHLVIVTRSDPLLPLARWRLRGSMVEIRQNDLHFLDQEAAQFMQTAVDEHLDPDFIIRLNQHMEGWIAGLRLASISFSDHPPEEILSTNLSGDLQNSITSYFFTEVLSHQPAHVQNFLLQTAFVDRFCVELSQDLVQFSIEDVPHRDIISHLLQSNLFIIPLDQINDWFRYHHLFRRMLQQKAYTQLGRAAVLAIHERAASWFAKEGYVDEALQQYMEAQNVDGAILLIENNSHNLLNSLERQRLERWMTLLPEEAIWQRPRLLMAQAWLLYRHWRLKQLKVFLDHIRHLLDQDSNMDILDKEFIMGQVQALSSIRIYCLENNYMQGIHSGEQSLKLLPPSEQGALGIALASIALSLQASGDFETAENRLNMALNDLTPQGPAWIQIYLGLSFLYLTSGDLLAFNRVTTQFLASSAVSNVGLTAANWVAGIAYYEANQLSKAQEAFSKTATFHYTTNLLAACDSWLALARIQQEKGELSHAKYYIERARSEVLRLECMDLIPVIDAVQAYQWHLDGQEAMALRWTTAFQPDSVPDYPMLTFTPLLFWSRILAEHGDEKACSRVRQILAVKLAAAQKNHQIRRQIQLLAHIALVESQIGNKQKARQHLVEALTLAKPGGFIRSFVDCGLHLKPLLQEEKLHIAFPHYINQILAAYYPIVTNQLPVKPILTKRETEILQLMQAGHSNKEIAGDLVISLYTVKRHASNIYRKLDVTGRRHAIYKAQQLGVLSTE